LFLALCFGVSWAAIAAFAWSGIAFEGGAAAALTVLVGFPPGIAALAVKGAIYGEPVRDDFGFRLRPNRWFLAAWLIPALVAAMTVLGAAVLAPGAELDLGRDAYLTRLRPHLEPEQLAEVAAVVHGSLLHPLVRELLFGMISGTTFGAAIALMQELAWRGFLHHELELGPVTKALLIGAIWGVWRAPLAALGSADASPLATCAAVFVWSLGASLVLAYVRERSDSVVAAAISHGTFVGTAGLAAHATGGDPIWVGQYGVAGVLAISVAATACAFALRHPRRLAS
jgi:membrane protease YdiL (CAAX protease family)